MKAAVLRAFGHPFSLETRPDPVAGPGEAVVEVHAARVLAYMRDVVSGARAYNLALPAVPGPGAVGRVVALGPDATRLKLGDWVLCDPTLRSRDDALTPDIALQGLVARGPGGEVLQQRYAGSFAEKMLCPLENLAPLGDIDPGDAPRWCALGTLLVPYGGLLAIDLKAGERLVVSGATGNFGGAAVMLGLAMGVSRVIACGRSRDTLAKLETQFGARVKTVAFTGDAEADRAAIQAAAGGPPDAVIDILPPQAEPAFTRAAILSLREFGRAALMGGQPYDVAIPYNWLMRNSVTLRGQWMYPRTANASLIALARAGLVDLAAFKVTGFALEEIAAALDHAAAHAAPFHNTVLTPCHAAVA